MASEDEFEDFDVKLNTDYVDNTPHSNQISFRKPVEVIDEINFDELIVENEFTNKNILNDFNEGIS